MVKADVAQQMDPMEGGDVMDPGSRKKLGSTTVEVGPIKFDISYTDLFYDQGVSLRVLGEADGKEIQLLRFDCLDQVPHYHYDPNNRNERHDLDKATAGNPIGWTLHQLRTNLPAMLKGAGASELAMQINVSQMNKKLDEVESIARDMATNRRATVIHNRGDVMIEAGNIRFGLEYRHVGGDRGLAIHVLGDIAGQEVEILAFDCFENEPHYHYGPRNKNIRLYWDKTAVPDTLRWTLDQFKSRKLPAMIEKAGYPGIVAELDEELMQAKLVDVEATALAMAKQNA